VSSKKAPPIPKAKKKKEVVKKDPVKKRVVDKPLPPVVEEFDRFQVQLVVDFSKTPFKYGIGEDNREALEDYCRKAITGTDVVLRLLPVWIVIGDRKYKDLFGKLYGPYQSLFAEVEIKKGSLKLPVGAPPSKKIRDLMIYLNNLVQKDKRKILGFIEGIL
jgi:hypothetical protein